MGGICVLGALYACTDTADVSAPGANRHSASVGFAPRYAYLSASSYMGDPINRIRLTARNQATGEIVGTLIKDVDPNEQNWSLSLDVTLDSQISVVVTIELINVTNGSESVQWSGLSSPITVAPAQPTQNTAPVTLYQGPPENLTVRSVDITPDSASVQEGATAQFSAVIDGPAGAHAVWSTSDPAVATIEQSGVLSALRSGVTMVYAVAGPRVDSARVRIGQRVNSIVVAPDTQRVGSVGADAAFSARVLDPRGADVNGAAVTWSIENPAIADNLGNGHFRAKANGVTRVFAQSTTTPSVRSSGVLVVSQRASRVDVAPAAATLTSVGAHQSFTAVVRDANGNAVTLPIRWRSANAAVATIDSTGNATAVATGSADIFAVAGVAPDTVSGKATLQVTQAVSSVEVQPASVVVPSIGDTTLFSFTARDANRNAVAGVHPVWLSTNAAVAAIDTAGRAVALSEGAATIIGQLGELRATATITVQQNVAALAITPADHAFSNVGQSFQFSATATDARHNAVLKRRIAWSSSDTAVATVDSTGLVRSRAAGHAQIRAALDALVALASVSVNPPAPADLVPLALTVMPADSVRDGDSATITLKVRNAGASAAAATATHYELLNAGTHSVITDSLVAFPSMAAGDSVTNTMRVRVDLGPVDSVSLRATLDAANQVAESNESNNVIQTGVLRIRYRPAVLLVTPDSARFSNAGDSLVAAVQVLDRFNRPLLGRTVTWRSADTTIVRVSPNGVLHAVRSGDAFVVASIAALADTIRVRVGGTPASLVLLQDSVVLNAIGFQTHLSANVFDALHVPVPSAHVAWASLDPGIASVDTTGQVQTFAAGRARIVANAGPADTAVVIVRQVPAAINLSANNVTLQPRDTFRLGATVRDSAATLMPATVGWHSADTTIAVVDASGLITARGNGNTQVSASFGTLFASAAVQVNAANLAFGAVSVAPDPIIEGVPAGVSGYVRNTGNVASGNSLARVRVLNAVGDSVIASVTLPLPPIAAHDSIPLAYVLTDSTVVLPDSLKAEITLDAGNAVAETNELDNLLLTPVHAVRVRVATSGLPARIQLNAIGDTVRLVPALRDHRNRPLNRRVRYSSRNSAVAVVDTAGLVHALSADSTLIYVISDSIAPRLDSVFVIVSQTVSQVLPERGDTQSAVVNTEVADSLGVRVLDSNGNGVPGVLVTWTPADGAVSAMPADAYVTGIGARPFLAPITSRTNASGVARVRWRLGTHAGAQTLTACAENGGCVTFHGRGRADKADHGAVHKGDGQLTTVGTVAGDSLILQVSDIYGNPTPNVVVEWSAVRGAVSSATTYTDSAGVAMTQFVADTVKGARTVTATVRDGQTAFLAATFHIRNKAAAPAQGSKRHGEGITATVSPTLGDSLEVQLRDRYGNTVDSTRVQWTVLEGNGKLPGDQTTFTTTTDTAGVTYVNWTLGTHAGRHRLRATLLDAATPIDIDFTDNPRADKAHGTAKVKGEDQVATVGTVAGDSLTLTVTDQYGNAVAGAHVQWSISAGAVSDANTLTDSSGAARVQYTFATRKGAATATANVVDDSAHVLATETFHLKAHADVPTGATRTRGGGITAIVSPTLSDSLQIQLLDRYGNGVDSAQVTFAVQSGGGKVGGLDQVTVQTDSSGYATVPWTMGTRAGAHHVHVTVNGAPVTVDFNNTAKAAAPDRAHSGKTRGDNQQITVKQSADSLQVSVQDAYGNAVSGARVQFSAPDTSQVVNPSSIFTDAGGHATVGYTMGRVKGPQLVYVQVLDSATNAPLFADTFRLKGRAASPAQTTKRHGEGITATVSPTLGDSIEIQLRDAFGNTVDSTRVQWTVQAGNGRLPGDQTTFVTTTDTAGVTFVQWTLGTHAGQHRLRATLLDAATPVTLDFIDEPHADKAHGAAKVKGEDQVATVGTVAGDSLTLTVTDQYGNAVPDATVHWSISAGSVSDLSTLTDSSGIARVQYRFSTQKGAATATATVLDDSLHVLATETFHLKAHADAPAGASRSRGGHLTAVVSPTLTDSLQIQVLDQYDNGVDSAHVVFTVQGGGGKISGLDQLTVLTDSDGYAMVPWTLGTKAGLHTVRAAVDGYDLAVFFSNTATADRPHGSSKRKGDNQIATVGTIAGDSLIVTVTDQYNNAVPGAAVHWSATGGVLSDSLTATNDSGAAMVAFTLGTVKGQKSATALVFSGDTLIGSISFNISGKADKPASAVRTNSAQSKHGATVSATLSDTVQIRFTDQYGNTVENVPVSWSKLEGDSSGLGVTSPSTDTSGLVSGQWVLGKKAGRHRISVRAGTGADTFAIALSDSTLAGPVRKLHLSQAAVQLDALGDSSTTLTTTPTDTFDNVVNATTTWTSRDTTKASIGSNGKIRTRGNGSTKLIATAGGFTDSATVTVAQKVKFLTIDQRHDTITALQFKKALTQTQKDRNGQVISDSVYRSAVTWVSRDTAIAKFVGDSLLSVANGTVAVAAIASADSTVLDSVFVEIKQAANNNVISFTAIDGTSPAPQSVAVNGTIQLKANAVDPRGNPVRKWTWSASPNSAVQITVSNNSQDTPTIKGLTSGTVTLNATTPYGQTASIVITITP